MLFSSGRTEQPAYKSQLFAESYFSQMLPDKANGLNEGVSKAMSQLIDNRSHDRPLLGYDWIAGILDNIPVLDYHSEEYFDSIKEFRRRYKDECVGHGGLA